jgi:UDP:flavonoid glycosyltransferase YjiC (YdhE family)
MPDGHLVRERQRRRGTIREDTTMSRFLFVAAPRPGRIRPLARVVRALAARGHEVAWAGDPDVLAHLVAPPAMVFPTGHVAADRTVDLAAAWPVAGLRSPVGVILHWQDYLLPLARHMLPGVRAAVDALGPDVVVVDQDALAGAAVAHAAGLPWATSVSTSAGLADPLGDLPEVARGIRRRLRRFLREAGLDDLAAARIDPRSSPHLVLAFTREELTASDDLVTDRCVFVGPWPGGSWGTACARREIPDPRSDPSLPLVLVGFDVRLGPARARLVDATASALAPLEVKAVMAAPPGSHSGLVPGTCVVPRGAWRFLLRQASAVVCDGGHTTVCAALAHGVPLVVAPVVAEQPIVAQQVARAGLGVRITGRRPQTTVIQLAVQSALTDPCLRARARRMRQTLAATATPHTATTELEQLASPSDQQAPKHLPSADSAQRATATPRPRP